MAKRLEQALHKEDMQIANKHIKRYSTLLLTREMQMKATMWYHYIPTTRTKSLKDWLSVGKDLRELEFSYIASGCVKWKVWKIIWHCLIKFSIHWPHNPAIPLQMELIRNDHTNWYSKDMYFYSCPVFGNSCVKINIAFYFSKIWYFSEDAHLKLCFP